ncbi:hypothetical protein MCHI_003727 [Candidatus Magnetoovum chiemensis]|nr:hypothetical protein MCHI_003727 [Candidatus Magnetoovum chiemensis]
MAFIIFRFYFMFANITYRVFNIIITIAFWTSSCLTCKSKTVF